MLFIDSGYEAFHLGIANVISVQDTDHRYFASFLGRMRSYASDHARRNMVHCDVHHTTGRDTVSLPFLAEFDNWASSGSGGQAIGGIWIRGWDEIDWFARLAEEERNNWLSYAHGWVSQNTSGGHLQMPTRRILMDPAEEGVSWYMANTASPACENGFSREETIGAIWRGE